MRFVLYVTVLVLLVLGVFLAGGRPTTRPVEVAAPPPPVEAEDDFDEEEWAFFLEDDEEDDAPLLLAVQVLDGADEQPVSGLRFRLERSTVGESEGPLEVVTDAAGWFEMPWTSVSAIVPLTQGWELDTDLPELYRRRVLRVHRTIEVVVQLRTQDGFDPGALERARLMTTPRKELAHLAFPPRRRATRTLPWPRFDASGRASYSATLLPHGEALVWHPTAYVTPIRPLLPDARLDRVVVAATLRPRPVLRGRVLDQEGEPIAHAWVGVNGDGEGWHRWFGDYPPLPEELVPSKELHGVPPGRTHTFARYVQADAAGHYEVLLPAPATIVVRASAGPPLEGRFERLGEVGPEGLERDLVLRARRGSR